MRSTYLLLSIFIFNYLNIKAQTFVDQNANGLNNGSTWENAYTDLVTAISNTTSGEIWVAKGLYYPDNDQNASKPMYKSFRWEKEISLIGGFTGNEISKDQRDPTNNLTILSGDVGKRCNSSDNSVHVVFVNNIYDSTSVLDGFIITGGYFEQNPTHTGGAGIYADNCGHFKIRNCVIYNNYSYHGGGMYINNSDPIIENNIFHSNTAFEGGGILIENSDNVVVKNNLFLNNQAVDSPMGGYSANEGGAINIKYYARVLLEGNTIINNIALNEGGGIIVKGNYSVNIINNYIGGNNSNEEGGGIYISNTESFIYNNIIVRNEARFSGGGLSMEDQLGFPRISFSNNTIAFNKSGTDGGGLRLEGGTRIYNSIFYYNTALHGNQISYDRDYGIAEFTNDLIENGFDDIVIYNNHNNDTIPFSDTITNAPLFADTLSNDFQLRSNSPAINHGTADTTGLNLPGNDILNNNRIFNDTVDIGAIEFNGENEPSYNFFDHDSIYLLLNQVDSFIIKNTSYKILIDLSICQGDSIFLEDNFQKSQGIYYDTLSSVYGSDSIIISQLTVNECISNIRLIKENESIIYPNPCNNYIVINDSQIKSITLYSVDGILLYKDILNNDHKIDVSFLDKGLYIAKLDNNITKLIIKE